MTSLRREREVFRSGAIERQGEPREHRQVGVERDLRRATDAEVSTARSPDDPLRYHH